MAAKHLKLDSIQEAIVDPADNIITILPIPNLDKPTISNEVSIQRESLLMQYAKENKFLLNLKPFLLSEATKELTLDEYENLLDEFTNYFNFDNAEALEHSSRGFCAYPPQSKFSSNILFLHDHSSSKVKGKDNAAFIEILKNAYNNQNFTQDFESRLWKCHLILNSSQNEIHTFQFLHELDYLHFVYAVQFMTSLLKETKDKRCSKQIQCPYKQGVCQYIVNTGGTNSHKNVGDQESNKQGGLFHRFLHHHAATTNAETKNHFTNSDTFEFQDNVLIISYQISGNSSNGINQMGHLEIQLEEILAIALHADYTIPMPYLLTAHLNSSNDTTSTVSSKPGSMNHQMLVKVSPPPGYTAVPTNFGSSSNIPIGIHTNSSTGEMEYCHEHIFSSIALPVLQHQQFNPNTVHTSSDKNQHCFVTVVPLSSLEWSGLLEDTKISTSENNRMSTSSLSPQQWKVDIISFQSTSSNNFNTINTNIRNICCPSQSSSSSSHSNSTNFVHVASKTLSKAVFLQDIVIPSSNFEDSSSSYTRSSSKDNNNLTISNSSSWKGNSWTSPKRSNSVEYHDGNLQSGKLVRSVSPSPSSTKYAEISNENSQFSRKGLIFGRAIPVELVVTSMQQQQQQQSFKKALRLVIQRASDITLPNVGKSYTPSVYCTAYLVGKDNERLTMNQAEVRTEAIKSYSPSWDHEILLQDASASSIDDVFAVMILLRDSSSGILKHKHIGQVTIPIECFLPEIEANLSLPLEPSYRMDAKIAEKSFIGDIHVITQLIDVESKAENPSESKNKTVALKKRLSMRTPSMELANMSMRCTLYKTNPLTTWWPIKVLSSTSSYVNSSAHNEKHSDKVFAGSSSLYSRVYDGFLLAAPQKLLIKLDPNLVAGFRSATSVTAGSNPPARRPSKSGANTTNVDNAMIFQDSLELSNGVLHVPWQQVENAYAISPGGLLLTLTIHFHTSVSNAGTETMKYIPASIEVIVGPCPSYHLREKLIFRKKHDDMIRTLIELYKEQSSSSGTLGDISPSSGKSNLKLSNNLSVTPNKGASNSPPVPQAPYSSPSSVQSSGSKKIRMLSVVEIVTRTHTIVNNLLNSYHEIQQLLSKESFANTCAVKAVGDWRSNESATLALPFVHAEHAKWESIWIQLMYQYFQKMILKRLFCSSLYYPFLMQAEEIPHYSNQNNFLTEMIENDVYDSSIMIPMVDGLQHHSSAADLVVIGTSNGGIVAGGTSGPILQQNFLKRFEGYFDSFTETILDYIIFSQKVLANNQKPVVVPGGDEENFVGWYLPQKAKVCLEILILGYYQGIVKALSIYIGKKSCFVDKTVTHEMRYTLIQFLFLYQYYFPVMLRRVLYMTNLVHFKSKYPLTLCQHLPKVMKWYVLAMLEDLKEELTKAIIDPQNTQQSENDDVTNLNSFPWIQNFAAQCLYYIEKYFVLYPDSTFSEIHSSNSKNASNLDYSSKSSKENLLNILAIRTQAYRSQFSSHNRKREENLLTDKTNDTSRKSFNHEEKVLFKDLPRSRRWILTIFYDNKSNIRSTEIKDSLDTKYKIDGLDEILPSISSLNEQLFLGILSFWKTIVFEEMLKFTSTSIANKLQQLYSLSYSSVSVHNPNVVLQANNLAEDLIRQVCAVDQVLFESLSAFAASASAYLPHHLQPKLVYSNQCHYAISIREIFNQYFLLFDVSIQQMATLVFISSSLQNVLVHYDASWTENINSGSNAWDFSSSNRQNSSNQSLRHIMQNLNKTIHDYEAYLQLQQPSSDSSSSHTMHDNNLVEDMASEEYNIKMMGSHDERYRGYLISLIYTSSEMIVMRYLLLFRDKLVLSILANTTNGTNSSGSSGEIMNSAQPAVSNEDKQRLSMDIEYLKEQFAILLQSVGYDEVKVKQRAKEQQKRAQDPVHKVGANDETSKDDDSKAIWWLPKLDYFSSRWVQYRQSGSNSNSLASGSEANFESYYMPLPLLVTPIEWLYVFYALVFEDHHSVAFNTSLNTFLQFHRFCDYTTSTSAAHDFHFVDDFIYHVIIPLRSGYQDPTKLGEVVNYLQEIISSYHNHNAMYDYSSSTSSETGSVKKDVLYRIFGEDLAVNSAIYNVGSKTTFFPKSSHPSTVTGSHSKVAHGNLANIASSAMKTIRTTLMQNVLSVGNNNSTAFPNILLKSNRHTEEYASYILTTIGFEFGFSMCNKLAVNYNISQHSAHTGGSSLPPTPLGGGSLSTTPVSSLSSSPFCNLGIKEILLAGSMTPNVTSRSNTTLPGWLWDAASDDEIEDSVIATVHNDTNECGVDISTPLKRKDSFRSSMKSMFSMSERKNSFNGGNNLFSPSSVPTAVNISNNNIVAGRTMSNSSGSGFTSGIVNLVRTSSNQKVVSTSRGIHLTIDNIAIKGLHSSSFLGKANPYIAFSSGPQRVKTSTKYNVNEANWKDEAPLTLTFPSREIIYQSTLLVEVFDKERIRRKHMLGLLELPLSNHIINSGDEDDNYNWYVIKVPSSSDSAFHGGAGSVAGEVAFSLKLRIDS